MKIQTGLIRVDYQDQTELLPGVSSSSAFAAEGTRAARLKRAINNK
jgi:hypothetical protein